MASELLALFSWVCAKAGRTAIFWLVAGLVIGGAVRAFENFALDLPLAIDIDEYDAVVIWCEAFKQFITAARLENWAVCLYAAPVMGFAHRHKSGAKRKSPCWLR